MNAILRGLITAGGLIGLWAIAYVLSGQRNYLLPSPWRVAEVATERYPVLLEHAAVTATEILLGLVIGAGLGIAAALVLATARGAGRFLWPVLVASQAVPVFAIAPVLVLWLGFGMASKIAMAALIIFFPVTVAFYDGLRRTDPGWLALARSMNASRFAILRHIRIPAALPAFASGLKVAAAVAPIGAVVGEWVGSAAGLGHLMLNANARGQTDVMFAALIVLTLMALALYGLIDWLAKRMVPWQTETNPTGDAR